MAAELTEAGLCRLPLEILQQIAGYLADVYRPSLCAFSLASRSCHRASTLFVFRQIHLKIRTREELQVDVNSLRAALSRTDSARHVHSLALEGFLDLKKPRNEKGFLGDVDPLGWWYSLKTNEILPDEEQIPSGEYFVYDESVIRQHSEEDLAWTPVISLIRTLPSLEKLVYNCPNQFPPSLLDALHARRAHCQLHHLTFRMRTLLWGTPYPYEMALATSPCLHKVKVMCTGRDSEADDDFNQEAMMELVAGLAPNLKEATIVNFNPGRGGRSLRRRARWQGLPGFASGSVGSLASLSIITSDGFLWTPGYIQTWARFTDFESLRRLTLGTPVRNGLNDDLMKFIAENYRFPQLTALCIAMRRNDETGERVEYGDNIIAFFTALEPLEELSVCGPLEPEILDAVLHRHGQTLRKLVLRPWEDPWSGNPGRNRHEIPMAFTRDHIVQIQAQCPALEELGVPVRRTQSNAAEVEMYRTLARIRRLRSLLLILDWSNWRLERDDAWDPAFDEEDLVEGYGVKKGHLRAALVNCAVGETLARSIWETVRQGSKRLESLKLWADGPHPFGRGQCVIAESLFKSMSRSWLIERVPRDDGEVTNIKELNRSAREAYDRTEADGWAPRPKEMEVFRRIWPSKEGSRGWRDDWSSGPLQD
ncbi:unnamed protein product [Clonostachys solani]|uniref:F-box domain-containing protein n=1 Tax=Clonostachys solani TaxID=160281 RepID=A0A9N9Z4S3_9HYPO|nr:unnamed protein product [Clonostachys solani]